MKKIFCATVILFTAITTFSQNAITDAQICAKITEVTENNISHDPKEETIKDGVVKDAVLPFIEKQGRHFHLDNGEIYDEQQFSDFLTENNLTHVWNQYAKGCRTMNNGWTCIGLGLFAELVGTIVLSAKNPEYTYAYRIPVGVSLCVAGGILEIAGIPLTIIGAGKKKSAVHDYNNLYRDNSRSQNIRVSAGITNNGIGLTIGF